MKSGRPFGISGSHAARGFVLGLAAGLVWLATRPHRGPVPDLIDWGRVRAVAATLAAREARLGSSSRRAPQMDLRHRYELMVTRSADVIGKYVGLTLPPQAARTYVFDRVEWVDANVEGFRALFEPMERLNQQLMAGGSVASLTLSQVNRAAVSSQMGLLIGYLAKRVLGQYDLSLLGKETIASGRLYFVEPNIAALQQRLGLHPYEFRLWISLHETTHAFEFECHPWLREHMNGLLTSYFESVGSDLGSLRTQVKDVQRLVRRIRANVHQRKSLVEMVMTGEQQSIFDQLQALMCVVEGYSNHVMNHVGSGLLASYPLLKARFEDRLRKQGPGERIFARVTGLDVKLEQYVAGERFVDHIVERKGIDYANRVWASAWHLPTLDEVRNPDDWIARVA